MNNYACGQFFKNIYQTEGEDVFKLAAAGNSDAIKMYEELGTHLGNAIKMIMYTYDVELIVLGGSVRHAWQYFYASMWRQVKTFVFPRSLNCFKIEISSLENSGLLGASVLCIDAGR